MNRRSKQFKKQSGALILAAVVLILVTSFVGLTTAKVIVSNQQISSASNKGSQASYLSTAALQHGILDYKNNFSLASPATYCDGAWKTTQTMSPGEFRHKCTHYSLSTATLSSNINSSTKIIPVSTISGYAPVGRITINSESIDYAGTSTDSSVCGAQPCFIARTRGANSTTAASHTSGDTVSQSHQHIEAEGAIPDVSSPEAKHTVHQAIIKPSATTVYTAGDECGDPGYCSYIDPLFIAGTNSDWTNQNEPSGREVYAIDMVSSSDGWAGGRNGYMYRYDGTSWSYYGDIGAHIRAIYCVESNDCWAVGNSERFYHYNGTSWSQHRDTGGDVIRGLTCVTDSTGAGYECWAVGNNAEIFHYDPISGLTQWTKTQDLGGSSQDIFDVFCVTWDDCWAVGENGWIYRKTNTDTWSAHQDIGSEDFEAIWCVATDDCWAVDRAADIFHYTGGGTWPTDEQYNFNEDDLHDIECVSANECYAVGDDWTSSEVLIVYWNGTTWAYSSGRPTFSSGTDPILRGLSIVSGGSSIELLGWKDVE